MSAAVQASDRDLDRALSDVGVLPPLDLSQIRRILGRPGTVVTAGRNADGHAIVEVSLNLRPSALIHHDGRVQLIDSAAA